MDNSRLIGGLFDRVEQLERAIKVHKEITVGNGIGEEGLPSKEAADQALWRIGEGMMRGGCKGDCCG
jgi:hypothetical protein